MNKRILIALSILLLVSVCALSACSSATDENESGVDVQQYDDLDSMNAQLDVNVNLPEGAEKAQFNIVDGTIAQSDYYLDDIHYVVRVTKGEQENLSGISADETFTNDETVEICGLDVRLRYNMSEVSADTETSYGIADAYDADTDISYCVFMIQGGQKDLLMEAMEKLITGETTVDTENGDGADDTNLTEDGGEADADGNGESGNEAGGDATTDVDAE